MAIEITCRRCGFSFLTNATTATRCRQCGHSVRVGSGSGGTTSRRPGAATCQGSQIAPIDVAILAIFAAGWLYWGLTQFRRWWRNRRDDEHPENP